MSYTPLIEVAFEIRFQPRSSLATELLLKTIETFEKPIRVKNSDGYTIPEETKAEQPELYYVPSYRMVYQDFSILISDGSLVVVKNYLTGQYHGWESFKPEVLELISILENKNKISDVQRYSLKYTNLFNEDFLSSDTLNIDISLGKNKFDFENTFELKTQSINEQYITMLIASSQVAVTNTCDVDGTKINMKGFLLMIDLIVNVKAFEIESIEKDLEDLHAHVYKEFINIYPDHERIKKYE